MLKFAIPAFWLLAAAMSASIPIAALATAQSLAGDGDDDDDEYECSMTDHAIRASLSRQGYTQIMLNVPIDNAVRAHGTKGGMAYVLKVSTCNGRILDRRPHGTP